MTASFSKSDPRRRAWWLKMLHEWHWVSSALCLVGMLLFAITGLTLNHAAQIESKPRVLRGEAPVDGALLEALATLAEKHVGQGQSTAPVPQALAQWARARWGLQTLGREAEWSEDEIYVALPRPGGDAWLRVDLGEGRAEYEWSDRGWIAYFNDLHKGRHTGVAWMWFIDVFAVACLVFTLTGLFIIKMHAGNRPWTWPLVGMGLVLPLLLALLLVH